MPLGVRRAQWPLPPTHTPTPTLRGQQLPRIGQGDKGGELQGRARRKGRQASRRPQGIHKGRYDPGGQGKCGCTLLPPCHSSAAAPHAPRSKGWQGSCSCSCPAPSGRAVGSLHGLRGHGPCGSGRARGVGWGGGAQGGGCRDGAGGQGGGRGGARARGGGGARAGDAAWGARGGHWRRGWAWGGGGGGGYGNLKALRDRSQAAGSLGLVLRARQGGWKVRRGLRGERAGEKNRSWCGSGSHGGSG